VNKGMRTAARLAISASFLSGSSVVIADDARSWWKTQDQRGVELLQSGDAEKASEVFRDSQWRGVSHYRNGNFAEAQKEFSGSTDPQSLYNEGTAAARAGDYQTAVEKLEQLTESDPAHMDGAHNLDIARQLLDAQQQSSDDSQQGEQDDSESSDSEEQSGDQSQSSDQQQNEQQDGEQQDGEGQQGESQQSDAETSDQQNGDRGGELSADEDEAKAAAEENQNQSAQSPSEQEQSESSNAQAGNEQPDEQSEQSESVANFSPGEPISESEQATEQWMRRIPDDPSQLLRNKIKLNHMIQHENVRDLAEPW